MKLVANWREVLSRAWSVRLTLFAALLDGASLGWAAFTEAVPPLWFLSVSMALSVAAAIARIVDQGIGKA